MARSGARLERVFDILIIEPDLLGHTLILS
jgi:hypothetical protein